MNNVAAKSNFKWKDFLLAGLDWYRQCLEETNFDFLTVPIKLEGILASMETPLMDQTRGKSDQLIERVSFGKIYYGCMHLIRKKFKIQQGPGVHSRVQSFLYKNMPQIAGRFGVLRRMREWADYYEKTPLWTHLHVNKKSVYRFINNKLSSVLKWLTDQLILT